MICTIFILNNELFLKKISKFRLVLRLKLELYWKDTDQN